MAEWKKTIKEHIKEFWDDTKRYISAFFFFGIAVLAFWGLIKLLNIFYGFDLIYWFKTLPYISDIVSFIALEVKKTSFLGVFSLFSFSSIFFLPSPLEVIFITLVKKGSPMIVFPATFLGIIFGQHLNYLLGRVFGPAFTPYIKKKTKDKTEERLRKYGAYAISIFHLIPPLPFPLFNFVCGLSRYPYLKWLLISSVATLVKLSIIFAIVS